LAGGGDDGAATDIDIRSLRRGKNFFFSPTSLTAAEETRSKSENVAAITDGNYGKFIANIREAKKRQQNCVLIRSDCLCVMHCLYLCRSVQTSC
jgi:hypothetical protein